MDSALVFFFFFFLFSMKLTWQLRKHPEFQLLLCPFSDGHKQPVQSKPLVQGFCRSMEGRALKA